MRELLYREVTELVHDDVMWQEASSVWRGRGGEEYS